MGRDSGVSGCLLGGFLASFFRIGVGMVPRRGLGGLLRRFGVDLGSIWGSIGVDFGRFRGGFWMPKSIFRISLEKETEYNDFGEVWKTLCFSMFGVLFKKYK